MKKGVIIINNTAIIGLGLMGGSLAKALKKKVATSITGFDTSQVTIDNALKEGVIHYGFTNKEQLNWGSFDIIFLCTPVEITLMLMSEIEGKLKESCIVSDLSSTKEEIIKAADKLNYDFIGGHPMVGSEKNGYLHSKSHLFENAYYILTPTKNIECVKLKQIEEIILKIGAIPIRISADKHDLITAVISHVPHIVASALVHLTTDFAEEDQLILKLAAGGFKDITRIASANPVIWKQISISNREKIDNVLQNFITNIINYRRELSNQNEDYLQSYFLSAKEVRDQLKDAITTDIPIQSSLIVDIEDRPGMIAKIATLLYENEINIKNIGIIHNREFENGCLKIILENNVDKSLALKVLKQYAYLVYE